MNRRVLAGLVTVATITIFGGAITLATQGISKKENVDCKVCHTKTSGKKLTDKGKYYEALRTLDGYDRLIDNFGKCTHCHVGKAGSKKLTPEGERVRGVVKDMKGLFEWLREGHTGPVEK